MKKDNNNICTITCQIKIPDGKLIEDCVMQEFEKDDVDKDANVKKDLNMEDDILTITITSSSFSSMRSILNNILKRSQLVIETKKIILDSKA